MEFTGGYYEPILDSIYDSFDRMLKALGHNKTKVVFSNYNNIEPKDTYLIIDPTDIKQIGRRDESSLVSCPTETITTSTHYVACLKITAFGKGAGNLGTHIHSSITNTRTAFDELHKNRLAVLKKSSLRRNPQLRETEWIDAFVFDLDLTFSIYTRYTYDWVEYITVNGEIFKIPYREN